MARIYYRHFKSNVMEMISTTSPPTERCDNETEKKDTVKRPPNKDEI
jgi:hypothetical protein